jgi:hypothetical protein
MQNVICVGKVVLYTSTDTETPALCTYTDTPVYYLNDGRPDKIPLTFFIWQMEDIKLDVQHAREAPTEHPQWEFEDEDEEDNSKADESDDQVSIYFISNRTSFIKEISHYCKTTFLSVGKGLKICMSFVQVMIKYHLVVSLWTISSILNIIQPLHFCLRYH